ncbi:MAG TPA: cytochrome c3 family protein, partial [Verrucomicrobiae bacterium]|nr:cytochrome c3 family protein [Verrucomicrobiae bacterium]
MKDVSIMTYRKEFSSMKKLGLALSLSLVLVLVFSVVALAATNGPHGNYTVNTNSCASCHTTHTAQGAKLFKFTPAAGSENDTYRICIYCHDGTGSKYDAKNGMIKGTTGNYTANGGGFVNMTTVEGPTGVSATAAVTSIHGATSANGTTVAIPGGSQNASGKYELKCSSCHDPHGTSNDRQLVTSVNVYNAAGTAWQTVYTSPSSGATKINLTVANQLDNEQVTYGDMYLSNFCGACHTDYFQTAVGSGSATSGTYDTTKYRHRVSGNNGAADVSVLATSSPGYNATYFALPTSTGGNITCM